MLDTEFEKIVSENKNRVYNTCLSFIKDPSDAEDIAQEVFIEVFQHIDEFKGKSSLSTWIYRISVNKSLEFVRMKKALKRSGDHVNLNESLLSGNPFYHPGITLENKENAAILFSAIDRLSENQRIAFILCKVEGLSYNEIAKILDRSLSSIESLMHRAIQNLRSILKEHYETTIRSN